MPDASPVCTVLNMITDIFTVGQWLKNENHRHINDDEWLISYE